MVRFLATLLITVELGALAWGQSTCERPDPNFKDFLSKFKNNPSFRESRIILPLQYSETDPEKTTKEHLSLEQIRARKLQIICDAACAARLKGTEGQLCENPPQLKWNSAEFVQYSCGTDVYGYTFHFVRKNGCWFLQGLDVSGG